MLLWVQYWDMSKIFIIAGNIDQFMQWKHRNYPEMLTNGQIQSLQDIVYVAGVDNLKGHREPHGLFIGTWYTRNDIESILAQLLISGSILAGKHHDLMNIVGRNK